VRRNPEGVEYSETLKGFMMNPVIPGKAFEGSQKSEAGNNFRPRFLHCMSFVYF